MSKYWILKEVKPQDVNSLVQTPRSDDLVSGNRLRERLQEFETLEKTSNLQKFARMQGLCWNALQNRCRRRWLFWKSNSTSCWVRFQNFCRNPERTTFGPALEVHLLRFLGTHGIEIQIPSTTTPDWNSKVVTCRRNHRFVDELHLRDPRHNPTNNGLLLERSIAKESEPCSAELEPSRIEENHATQSKIPTNPVYYSKEVIPVGERKWNDISACESFKRDSLSAEISKLVMRMVRREKKWWTRTLRRYSLVFYGSKTAQSISEVRRAKIPEHGLASTHLSRRQQDKVPILHEFRKFLIVFSSCSRTHWWEFDSAWPRGSRRYSIQVERVPISSRMFILCHFNSYFRTHRWKTRKQIRKTDHLLHLSTRSGFIQTDNLSKPIKVHYHNKWKNLGRRPLGLISPSIGQKATILEDEV